MASFNLVDEPWLPCLMRDRSHRELSLREALVRAHEAGELFDPSPLVTVSLHRLLLAVLHRAHVGPRGLEDWKELWRQGGWDVHLIDAYLDRWRHRFDLFNPDQPFYQVPYLGDAEKTHPICLLAQEASAGNNATLFDHRFDSAPEAMLPSEAARYLVARQAFSIGFGKSQPFYFQDSAFVRGYSVLAQGDTLFETLALNLLPYDEQRPIEWQGIDAPWWEQREPATPEPNGTAVRGYCDYLTWQSRRIHLIGTGDPLVVRYCQLRQNLKLAGTPTDPFRCYVADETKGYRPRGFRPERALWRDSHILFQKIGPTSRRPELLNWLSRVNQARRSGSISGRAAYQLEAYGMTTDDENAASVAFWRHERLPLPLAYLEDSDLIDANARTLRIAETVSGLFRLGWFDRDRQWPRPGQIVAEAFRQIPRPGERADKAGDRFTKWLGAGHRYWSALDVPFARCLLGLPGDKERYFAADPDRWPESGEAFQAWLRDVERAARRAFDETAYGLGTSPRALKAVARAEREFGARLRAMLREAGMSDSEEERNG